MSRQSIQYYLELLADRPRMDAYARAVRRVVRPGDVVLDLGTGVGTLAVLCARLGARRVLAVEAGAAGRLVPELARANGVADRVRLLEGWSTTLAVPERADVCIFDDFDPLELGGAPALAVGDAVARWLRPGGRLIPEAVELWAAPVAVAGLGRRYRPPAPAASARTLDLRPLGRVAARMPWTVRAGARCLLARPRRVLRADLRRLASAAIGVEATTRARRTALVDGLLLWLRVCLTPGIAFDTGPASPATAYSQVLFPLPEPLGVGRGQRLTYSLRCATPRARRGRHVFWEWAAACAAGRSGASTFDTWLLPPVAALEGAGRAAARYDAPAEECYSTEDEAPR
jgi:protein arginine N-methyltransferase 1